jgi:DNA-binding transcriptional ArsR family regulator
MAIPHDSEAYRTHLVASQAVWPLKNSKDLDPVWKALADKTRRSILDSLRDGPKRTTQIVERFPALTRFGVMKHLQVLRDAGLVLTREEGRNCVNLLNAVPIRQIYERWVSKFAEDWAITLIELKDSLERTPQAEARAKRSRRED